MHSSCARRNLRAEFLSEPTEVNDWNETVKRPDAKWPIVARGYCSVETGGGREVYKAQQIHAEVNAVISMDWTSELAAMTEDHRIRVYLPDNSTITCEILNKDNVNWENQELKFSCKSTVT